MGQIKMTPSEFVLAYLPEQWTELDLQRLIQTRIQSGKFLLCPAEVRIKTKATVRRSDLETWLTRYEVKKELTYENLKSALAQLYIYDYYGSKILWLIPKRKVIIGLAPSGWSEYQSAVKLATDIREMGVQIVFLNENINWGKSHFASWQFYGSLSFVSAVMVFALSYIFAGG